MNELTKHCYKCNTLKSLDDFPYRKHNGKLCYIYKCKECDRKDSRRERAILLQDPIKKANLRALTKKSLAKHYQKNYAGFKVQLANNSELRAKVSERKKKWKKEQMKNFDFRLKVKLCSRLRATVKSGKDWGEYLGCSMEYLREWFEYHFRLLKVFDDIELSWDNYDAWEIDHVIPCKAFDFTDESQRKICFHWSNLAPLTKSANSSKRAKIIPHIIRRQLLLANIYNNSTGNDKTVAIATICDSTGALTTAANGKLLVQQVE